MADEPMAPRPMDSVELAEILVWSRADHAPEALAEMERELYRRGDAPHGAEALLRAAYGSLESADIGAIISQGRKKKLPAAKVAFLREELERRADGPGPGEIISGGGPEAEARRSQAALVLAIATRRPVVTYVLLGAIVVLA